jgi:hypothetical protein
MKAEHIGFKYLALVLGFMLAVLYAISLFFGFGIIIEDTVLFSILKITAFFVIVWPFICWIGEIIWRFVHKYSGLLWEEEE